jgi:hypothetical protein
MIIDWFNFVTETFAVVASLFALFEGTKLIAENGVTRRAIVTIFFGALMCISWASLNYFKFHYLSKTLALLESSGDIKVPPREQWSTTLTPEQREEIALASTRHEFFRHGTLTNYIDRDDAPKLFSPSQQEIKQREENVIQLTQLRFLADARLGDAISMSLWGLFSAIFGYFSGRRSKRDHAHS